MSRNEVSVNAVTGNNKFEGKTQSVDRCAEKGNEEDRADAVMRYLRLLGQAGEQFNQQLQRDHQVSQSQLACLNMLHREGSMPISRLARGLVVEPSTATGVIDRLEQKGMVKRIRQGVDRRVVTIELTEDGRVLAERSPSAVPGFLRLGMKDLDDEEALAIVNALARLVEMLQRYGTPTRVPEPVRGLI